jgi:PAS domain S-box-containing protein
MEASAAVNHVSSVGIALDKVQTAGMSSANMGILLAALDAHAIVSITQADGEIIEVNDHFCRLSGYQRSELIGKNHRIIKSGEHLTPFYEELWQTISGGLVWSGDICNRSKDGRLYWVATTIVPFLDDAGLPVCYVSIRTEITQIKQLTNSLQTSEERFRRSQEYANIGTWEWNIKTNDVYWSKQIAPLFGYRDVVETTFENFMNAVYPDDRAAVTDAIDRSVRNGAPYEVEHRVVWQDGTVHWLYGNGGVTRSPDGTPERMLGVVQDVTEQVAQRKALEEARTAADAANKAKTEFLSRMSHELRTPLNSILGFAQLLEIGGKLDASSHENVEQILRSGDHLLALINDVLDLARIEVGKFSLAIEPFHLQSVIEDSVAMVNGLANQRNVVLQLPDLSGGACVMGDRLRLRQVLINLLTNAIKYNRVGGEVRLTVTRDDTQWSINIADSGAGIDPDRLSKLFQPFTRLVDDQSDIEGTGIGLALSRNLVEAMGGSIHVTSALGVGSEFSVKLPEASGQSAGMVSASFASSDLITDADLSIPEKRALYVEDNPANTQLMREIFALRPNWYLMTAHTGPLGLDMAKLRKPDLLLLDIDLPGMSGFALLDALRSEAATRNIPAIAVTATVFANAEEHYLKAGFSAYVPKPIDVPRLLAFLDARANPERNS